MSPHAAGGTSGDGRSPHLWPRVNAGEGPRKRGGTRSGRIGLPMREHVREEQIRSVERREAILTAACNGADQCAVAALGCCGGAAIVDSSSHPAAGGRRGRRRDGSLDECLEHKPRDSRQPKARGQGCGADAHLPKQADHGRKIGPPGGKVKEFLELACVMDP